MAGPSVGDTKFFGKKEQEGPSLLDKALIELEKVNKENLIEAIDIPKVEGRIDEAYVQAYTLQHLWETYVIADMLGYIFIAIVVIFIIIIGLLLKKFPAIRFVLFFIALLVALAGPEFIKGLIDKNARSSRLENLEIKRFDYSDNIVVDVDLLNTGKFDYEECIVTMTFYKKTDRLPVNIVNRIKPLHEERTILKDVNQSKYKHIRYTIFKIPKEINFTLEDTRKCK